MINPIEENIQDVLNPGERVVWSGQPQLGFMLRTEDIRYIPFSLVWTGLVLYVVWDIINNFLRFPSESIGEWPALIMLTILVVSAFYALFGRLILDIYRR